jgi:two-component system OmpR family sensor kinase
MSRPRSLSVRLAAVTSLVALVAVLVTGLVAVQAVRGAAEKQVRQELGRQADLLVGAPVLATTTVRRENRVVGKDGLQLGAVSADGTATGAARLLPQEAVRSLLTGGSYSGRLRGADGERLVEGRPAPDGGAAVVSRPAGAVDQAARDLRRRLVLPLLAGLLMAAAAGVLLARVLARPLVVAAAAARRMAAGQRGVALPHDGPPEMRDLTTALAALDAELRSAEGERREFLLSVSHEMRTPLTTIRGYAEGLADGVVTSEDVPRTGRVLLAEAQRLESFVRDLLDLARLDAGEVRLERVPVDLRALVLAAAEVWRDRCEGSGSELVVEVPAAQVMIAGDPSRLRQVLDALADNALRLLPAGRPLVLAAGAGPGVGRLQVRDGGPGLTEQDQRQAFDRGVLHERYRGVRPGGSGLGLAIVSRLVERQGGRIAASQAPEGGACFTVELPAGGMLDR